MPAILSLVTSLLGRVIGSHLVGNNAAKAGTGTVQSLVEGFGMRFAVGAIATLVRDQPRLPSRHQQRDQGRRLRDHRIVSTKHTVIGALLAGAFVHGGHSLADRDSTAYQNGSSAPSRAEEGSGVPATRIRSVWIDHRLRGSYPAHQGRGCDPARGSTAGERGRVARRVASLRLPDHRGSGCAS